MPDREKVVKGLECLITNKVPCDGCPYNKGENLSCLRNIANDALELLKEQEPLRPKKWVPKGQVFGYCRGYYCPQCNTGISSGDRYCHWCGRELKWDE